MPEGTATPVRDDIRLRIVEVAARLLREQGASAVTTRGVAEAADVQPPTIYRLFGDKAGLIEAVAEHAMATHVAAKADAIREDDPVAALRAGWSMHIDFGLSNPVLFELLEGAGGTRPSPAISAGIQVLASRVKAIAAAGLLRVSEGRALAMIHAAGTGAVRAILETDPDDRDPGLADAMLEAVLAAIIAPSGSPRLGPGVSPVLVSFAARIPELSGLSDAERLLLAEWVSRSIAVEEGRELPFR